MCCRLSFRQEQFFYLKIRLVVHVVVASVGERFSIIWENVNGATYNCIENDFPFTEFPAANILFYRTLGSLCQSKTTLRQIDSDYTYWHFKRT